MLQLPLRKGPQALSRVGFSKEGKWFLAAGYVLAPADDTLPSVFPGQQPPWAHSTGISQRARHHCQPHKVALLCRLAPRQGWPVPPRSVADYFPSPIV